MANTQEWDMQSLFDRMQIQDALGRYSRAVDRREWSRLRDVFFEDAIDYHGVFTGKRDDFIEFISERHKNIEKAVHFLGSSAMEFSADRNSAAVETYFMAFLVMGPDTGSYRNAFAADVPEGNVRLMVNGRYADRFERRESGWGIAKRITVFDIVEVHGSRHTDEGKDGWPLGVRTPADPSYEIFNAL